MTEELNKTLLAGATISTVAMTYIFIDTFAYLGMPLTQPTNTRNDFINWVNIYLKTDANQEYKYNGRDMYGARCSLLHTFNAISDYTKKENCRYYAYDSGIPSHKPDDITPLVIISVERLVKDFGKAIIEFFTTALKNEELKSRINSRINHVFAEFEISP